jgi:hypothetical protein
MAFAKTKYGKIFGRLDESEKESLRSYHTTDSRAQLCIVPERDYERYWRKTRNFPASSAAT